LKPKKKGTSQPLAFGAAGRHNAGLCWCWTGNPKRKAPASHWRLEPPGDTTQGCAGAGQDPKKKGTSQPLAFGAAGRHNAGLCWCWTGPQKERHQPAIGPHPPAPSPEGEGEIGPIISMASNDSKAPKNPQASLPPPIPPGTPFPLAIRRGGARRAGVRPAFAVLVAGQDPKKKCNLPWGRGVRPALAECDRGGGGRRMVFARICFTDSLIHDRKEQLVNRGVNEG